MQSDLQMKYPIALFCLTLSLARPVTSLVPQPCVLCSGRLLVSSFLSHWRCDHIQITLYINPWVVIFVLLMHSKSDIYAIEWTLRALQYKCLFVHYSPVLHMPENVGQSVLPTLKRVMGTSPASSFFTVTFLKWNLWMWQPARSKAADCCGLTAGAVLHSLSLLSVLYVFNRLCEIVADPWRGENWRPGSGLSCEAVRKQVQGICVSLMEIVCKSDPGF